MLLESRLGGTAGQVVFPNISGHLLLPRISKLSEPAHIGEKHSYLTLGAVQRKAFGLEQHVGDFGRYYSREHALDAAPLSLLEHDPPDQQAQIVHQQRAGYGQEHRNPEARLHVDPAAHQREQRDYADDNGKRRHPTEPQGHDCRQRPQQRDQGKVRHQRRLTNEPARDDRVGHVPMFANQQGVALKRSGPPIGHVVADLRLRTHQGQFAVPKVRQNIGAQQAQPVFQQQVLNRFLGQARVFRRQRPVNIKVAPRIHGDHPLDTPCASQCDRATIEINVRLF